MDSLVFAAVLFAAACHAGWNAAIKTGLDPLSSTVLITTGAGLVSLALLPFVGLPPAAAWPWVIASVVIHLFYFIGLSEAYRTGDLGQVYPLARGSAPLMTAGATALLIGERIGPAGWCGVIVLAAGVLLLSLRGGRLLQPPDRRAVSFALFTALTICLYSVADGIGARTAVNPHPYTIAMFIGNALVMIVYFLIRRGPVDISPMLKTWPVGMIGGSMQLLSYGIAIWAMTLAPIALVAALRETSVLFGALIAVLFLKEPMRPARIVAALMIVCGLVAIRLS
ncbi:EamA family transporter [Pseudorhodoplanes sp.]|uniref:EamA family transporter n=1 Tax=Pseudorhodoplanes sp. TaxID=1934341 RepID=UPI002C6D2F51|nr:EamA family transporter [Pseudorhodoplanes sp.]HWV54273.1 EamA family transporter [Pseudorhodoplanes sp.]